MRTSIKNHLMTPNSLHSPARLNPLPRCHPPCFFFSRKPFSAAVLCWHMAAYPFYTVWVQFLIHYQAFLLWSKKVEGWKMSVFDSWVGFGLVRFGSVRFDSVRFVGLSTVWLSSVGLDDRCCIDMAAPHDSRISRHDKKDWYDKHERHARRGDITHKNERKIRMIKCPCSPLPTPPLSPPHPTPN